MCVTWRLRPYFSLSLKSPENESVLLRYNRMGGGGAEAGG